MRLHLHCALWQVVKRQAFLHVAALRHLQLHGMHALPRLAVMAGDVAALKRPLSTAV